MPRQARIDTPGALHHIIVEGIERRKIFYDDQERDVLRLYYISYSTAGRCCREVVKKDISGGRRPDFVGGG